MSIVCRHPLDSVENWELSRGIASLAWCKLCGSVKYGAEEWQHNAAVRALRTDMIPMLLWCPECSERHIDEGEFAEKPHHTHACQHCGHCWRPAIIPTLGVRFLPGFKNA